jgi:hypothetical protein
VAASGSSAGTGTFGSTPRPSQSVPVTGLTERGTGMAASRRGWTRMPTRGCVAPPGGLADHGGPAGVLQRGPAGCGAAASEDREKLVSHRVEAVDPVDLVNGLAVWEDDGDMYTGPAPISVWTSLAST